MASRRLGPGLVAGELSALPLTHSVHRCDRAPAGALSSEGRSRSAQRLSVVQAEGVHPTLPPSLRVRVTSLSPLLLSLSSGRSQGGGGAGRGPGWAGKGQSQGALSAPGPCHRPGGPHTPSGGISAWWLPVQVTIHLQKVESGSDFLGPGVLGEVRGGFRTAKLPPRFQPVAGVEDSGRSSGCKRRVGGSGTGLLKNGVWLGLWKCGLGGQAGP